MPEKPNLNRDFGEASEADSSGIPRIMYAARLIWEWMY